MIRIIESPREGMQGYPKLIPAEDKIRYINALLKVGFDTVETGSIVSAKLIPQMADSQEVIRQIDNGATRSNRMMLAVHDRGAEVIAGIPEVTQISYPFSFTPTFLRLNVNSTVERSMETVQLVTRLCKSSGKEAVIYISMAFGNPYGDPWSIGLLTEWVGRLADAGVRIIPLSNVSMEIDAALIRQVYSTLIPQFPEIDFGLHLHTDNRGWYDKVEAAWDSGCRRFDGVINGWGGCPMAGKELLGNLMTENLIEFAHRRNIESGIDPRALKHALEEARRVFI